MRPCQGRPLRTSKTWSKENKTVKDKLFNRTLNSWVSKSKTITRPNTSLKWNNPFKVFFLSSLNLTLAQHSRGLLKWPQSKRSHSLSSFMSSTHPQYCNKTWAHFYTTKGQLSPLLKWTPTHKCTRKCYNSSPTIMTTTMMVTLANLTLMTTWPMFRSTTRLLTSKTTPLTINHSTIGTTSTLKVKMNLQMKVNSYTTMLSQELLIKISRQLTCNTRTAMTSPKPSPPLLSWRVTTPMLTSHDRTLLKMCWSI